MIGHIGGWGDGLGNISDHDLTGNKIHEASWEQVKVKGEGN